MSNKWGITVTLKPLVGKTTAQGLGEIEVQHDLLMVFAGSRQIEMDCGHSPMHIAYAQPKGNTVEFLAGWNNWPLEAKQFIVDEVERLTETPRRGVFPAVVRPVPKVEEIDDTDLE